MPRSPVSAAGHGGPATSKAGMAKPLATMLAKGDVKSVEAWIEQARNTNKDVLTKDFFNSLARACAEQRSAHGAGWTLQKMTCMGIRPCPLTFNSIIDACSKVPDVAGASQWFSRMQDMGVQPTAATYNSMVLACTRARNTAGAETWMRRTLESGQQPSIISFSCMIDAFAKSGKLPKSEQWFEHMLSAGVAPDAIIYNSLINACAKASNPSKAEHWLERMHAAGLQPDERTLNSIISASAKAGLVDRAEFWFKEMERVGFNVDSITFGSVIHASALSGDIDRAEYWFQEMLRRGVPANIIILNTMLNVCAQTGNHQKAVKWFHTMYEVGVQPNQVSFNSVVTAFTMKDGITPVAEAWLEKMLSCGFPADTITYCILLRACRHSGNGNGKVLARNSQKTACEVIIRAHMKVGDYEGAKPWLVLFEMAQEEGRGECRYQKLPVASVLKEWQARSTPSRGWSQHDGRALFPQPPQGMALEQPKPMFIQSNWWSPTEHAIPAPPGLEPLQGPQAGPQLVREVLELQPSATVQACNQALASKQAFYPESMLPSTPRTAASDPKVDSDAVHDVSSDGMSLPSDDTPVVPGGQQDEWHGSEPDAAEAPTMQMLLRQFPPAHIGLTPGMETESVGQFGTIKLSF